MSPQGGESATPLLDLGTSRLTLVPALDRCVPFLSRIALPAQTSAEPAVRSSPALDRCACPLRVPAASWAHGSALRVPRPPPPRADVRTTAAARPFPPPWSGDAVCVCARACACVCVRACVRVRACARMRSSPFVQMSAFDEGAGSIHAEYNLRILSVYRQTFWDTVLKPGDYIPAEMD